MASPPLKAVAFEGNALQGRPAVNDVLSKIPDFFHHNDPPFSFFGARPARSRAQLADDLRAYGRKEGITVLILDCGPF